MRKIIGHRGLRGLRKSMGLKGLRRLMGLMGLLLVAGCQSDTVEPVDNSQKTTMELLSFSTPFLDVSPWTRADGYTDHLPDGYKSYETLHPHASTADSNIGVFMTPGNVNPTGDFIYLGIEEGVSKWKSSIVVEKDKDYYIYGFMPQSAAGGATISYLNLDGTGDEDFENGAVIHVNNFDALTTADVSVIVGLRWASETEKINGIAPDGDDVPLGHFKYTGMEEGNNRLFVLLKHIYAGLHFAVKLDPVYHNLRNIYITKVELTAQNIRPKVDLTITLTANDAGLDPLPLSGVRYTPTTGVDATNKTITLYQRDPDDSAHPLGVLVPEDHYEDFLGCLVPGSTDNLILRTTYDVYDKNGTTEGNLIRKDCVAENQINTNIIGTLSSLQAGELLTVNMLVKPTYLYVLSEPDLNNPTITLTATP